MGIIILRLIVIFYACGLIFFFIHLINKNITEEKKSIISILFFPFLILDSNGRKYLKNLLHKKGE